MPNQTVLGIDLGGTKIAAALVDLERKILWEENIPTMAHLGVKGVAQRMASLIAQASGIAKPLAVGLGSPGPLDMKKGLVVEAPNLGWHNVPIVELLEKASGLPVFLENDANVAALGEQVFGAGRGAGDLIYVTVSTGIGAGFIVNNRLVHGRDGGAGELGHVVVEEDGPLCGCGKRGCLEAVASGTAIARMTAERLRRGEPSLIRELVGGDLTRLNAKIVGQAAQNGDRTALEVVTAAAKRLGAAIAGLINIFNPEIVVIGGGVANLGELLFRPVQDAVRERAFPSFIKDLPIVPAALGGRAGVLGAAAVALERI